MNPIIGNLIVILFLGVVVFFAIRQIIGDIKGGGCSGCGGCGGDGCKSCCGCKSCANHTD